MLIEHIKQYKQSSLRNILKLLFLNRLRNKLLNSVYNYIHSQVINTHEHTQRLVLQILKLKRKKKILSECKSEK